MAADFCALEIFHNFFDKAWSYIEKQKNMANKQMSLLLNIDDVLVRLQVPQRLD